jgi:hypothetical protein
MIFQTTMRAGEALRTMKFPKTISVLSLVAMLAAAGPASTAPSKNVSIRQVEALCPGLGLSGLVLGKSDAEQDRTLVSKLDNLPPHFAPFTEAELEYTPWSDRLAAIIYRAASPDDAENKAWEEALNTELYEAGWKPSARAELASPLTDEADIYEKAVDVVGDSRVLFVEFDAWGALMLRCGDAELVELGRAEANAELEKGSARPQPPRLMPVQPLPSPEACRQPDLRAAFARLSDVDETSPVGKRLTDAAMQVDQMRNYHERLSTWLKWKLLSSGKVTDLDIAAIYERASKDYGEAFEANVEEFADAVVETTKAQESENPEKICAAFIKIVNAKMRSDQRDIAWQQKINEEMEREANKLSIDVR